MNLIGKIFIVLIFVMSLVFMSFAVAVYATHQDWKTVSLGLKEKLVAERDANAKLKDEHEKLRAQIAAELKDKVAKLAQLESEYKKLDEQYQEKRADFDKLDATNKAQVATLKTEGQNLKTLTSEVEKLRGEIRVTQNDRDKYFHSVVTLTEDINQANSQLAVLKERQMQLSGEIAAQKKVLDSVGLTMNSPVPDVAPSLRGKVLNVNPEKMIEISLGTDDGLKTGHTLEVFRGSKYLGRVEVMTTTFNRAIARIVPGYQQAIIQKGDDVATRLKVS